MAKQTEPLWGPFKLMALVFGGAGALVAVEIGSVLPLLIVGVALAVLAVVFNAMGRHR